MDASKNDPSELPPAHWQGQITALVEVARYVTSILSPQHQQELLTRLERSRDAALYREDVQEHALMGFDYVARVLAQGIRPVPPDQPR